MRLLDMRSIRLLMMFQFTHPGKGATQRYQSETTNLLSFNSRTLGRVRPEYRQAMSDRVGVSIHAPWEGCDRALGTRSASRYVSIHAPWEGCDVWCRLLTNCYTKFQFTHPGKGATPLRAFRQRLTFPFQFTHPGKGATERLKVFASLAT